MRDVIVFVLLLVTAFAPFAWLACREVHDMLEDRDR